MRVFGGWRESCPSPVGVRFSLSRSSLRPVFPPLVFSLSTCRKLPLGRFDTSVSSVVALRWVLFSLVGHVQANVGLVAASHVLHRAAGQVQLRGQGRHPTGEICTRTGVCPGWAPLRRWESHRGRVVTAAVGEAWRQRGGLLACRVVVLLRPLFRAYLCFVAVALLLVLLGGNVARGGGWLRA